MGLDHFTTGIDPEEIDLIDGKVNQGALGSIVIADGTDIYDLEMIEMKDTGTMGVTIDHDYCLLFAINRP